MARGDRWRRDVSGDRRKLPAGLCRRGKHARTQHADARRNDATRGYSGSDCRAAADIHDGSAGGWQYAQCHSDRSEPDSWNTDPYFYGTRADAYDATSCYADVYLYSGGGDASLAGCGHADPDAHAYC